ncbi:MAG TPA: ABC transporter transmembrane domain-containing protein [Alphaproteobacteria bacterium]|nr:ABC transporter transmembrane domain-containing protein [Alphaproteobacteria bacterium]
MTQSDRQSHSLVLLKRLLRTYLAPHKGQLAVAVLLMIAASITTSGKAVLIRYIFDTIFAEKQVEWILPIAGIVFVVFILGGFAAYGSSIILNRIGQGVVTDIQRDSLSHLIDTDIAFFHDHPAGELISRLTNDVEEMRYAIVESMTNSGTNALRLVGLLGVMFWMDWRLSVFSILVFPLAGIWVGRRGKRMRRVSNSTQVERGQFAHMLNQTFQNVRHIKAYGMEDYEKRRVGDTIQRLFMLAHKGFRISAISEPVNELLGAIPVCGLIIYGGHEVIAGRTTTGALMAFIFAFLSAYEPIKRLAKTSAVMQRGLSAAERLFALLDEPPTIRDREGARDLAIATPSIRLENVKFAYKSGAPALEGVTIDVPAGKTVALVGPSGAGKSTVLSLIPRFYEVDAAGGAVLIDGQDVRGVTLKSLRAQMALVSQEVALFDDTILSNIAYGRPGASEAEIVAAAKGAAADFIEALPEGYQTRVGENGVKLSGGQRQRIAIARALLRGAPILLLDEATSSLDAESERIVQEALSVLGQGRTVLVIAHRLSTVVNADLIYVMDRGRVAESGTHAELMRKGGLYSRLYGMQAAERAVAAE